jgi:hypothetical protein
MIVEAFRTWGGNSLKVLAGDGEVTISDPGEMRIAILESGRASVEVLSGGVTVTASGQSYPVKKKQSAVLGPDGVQTAKIKSLTADELTSWHEQRAKAVLAQTPKSQRRKGPSAYADGETPIGLGELPDRSRAGVGGL